MPFHISIFHLTFEQEVLGHWREMGGEPFAKYATEIDFYES